MLERRNPVSLDPQAEAFALVVDERATRNEESGTQPLDVGEALRLMLTIRRFDEQLLMVEMEMDKGTVEVRSPAAGRLRRIVVQPGTTVAVKTLIAEIGDPGEVVASPSPPPETAQSRPRSAGASASAAAAGRITQDDVLCTAAEQRTGGPATSQTPPSAASEAGAFLARVAELLEQPYARLGI